MKRPTSLIEAIRRQASPLENHLIDGYVDGRVSRRELLRHGSVLGLSLGTLGRIAGGAAAALPFASAARAQAGATIRVAQVVPAGAVDPVTVSSAGGLLLLMQTGEFLCVTGPDLVLQPRLATGWTPNEDGTVWTFELREGVTFHDGSPFNADAVVATFDRLSDPANASNALSAFAGFLSPGGTRAAGEHAVEFHLEAANGSFPYLVSSDNYNAILLPADYDGGFEQSFVGTGPFRLERYTTNVGATFVRNDDYWGERALPDRTEFAFYPDIQPMILALRAGEVDVIYQVPVLAGVSLFTDPSINVISLQSSAHQQIHMRTDMAPFQDKRVRRALALTLDRPLLVEGLMKGRAIPGNDSPFTPIYPTTDTSVPQREKNVAEARALLEAAGAPEGFQVTLTAQRFQEIPEYAQLVQAAALEIGVQLQLNILDQAAYYGDAVFGNSNWLDSTMGITDYGHRGVPNVYLSAPLRSDGSWNAARFNNPEYDRLVAAYIATADLEAQREQAGQIQTLLLDETPVIFGYFYDYLTATAPGVEGVQPTAISQLFLERATKA